MSRSPFAAAVLALYVVSCRSAGDSPSPAPVELPLGGLTWVVDDGKWRREGDALIGTAGNVWTREEVGDAVVEMDVEQNADNRPRVIGVGLRINRPEKEPAKASGYALNFMSDRTFVFMRGLEGQWTWLSGNGFQVAPALQPFKNHLVLRMQGAALTVTANGLPVFSGTDPTYPRGKITLWVESTLQTVRFSNIKVTKL